MTALALVAITPLAPACRRDLDAERARTAWLLAADLAEGVVEGTAFVRICATPGKVGRGSDAKTTQARKIACYLACTVANCAPALVAKAARLDRKTVHGHVNDVEDMRDDPEMDRLLDDLKDQMIRRAINLVMANLRVAA